jgi:tetratricopeptide (TPR) repeat protein
MQFCPQCGTQLIPDTRFCPGCGTRLVEFASTKPRAAIETPPSIEPKRNPRTFTMGPFAAIFVALMTFGAVVAYLITREIPAREQLLANTPAAPPAAANADNNLPTNHPAVHLSKEILAFIQHTEDKARAHPNDRAAWKRLGDVTLRAAAFDPSYYTTATEAYSHLLKANPDDLDALRGIGNIDFDQRKFDAAIAAYEHYLAQKPDDADVRTDLGTMLLSSGAADQAIRQYRRVLEAHPTFFEAAFNLGVAYENSSPPDARAAFARALKLAPDDRARSRVNQEIAALDGGNSAGASAMDGTGISETAPPGATASVATAPTNFRGAIEQTMRDLPVAGNKVQTVQWDSASKARILMNDFPMDQMPPFATAKFIADVKAGIDRAKDTYKVATPVQIDLCDAASGRVMQSVTE